MAERDMPKRARDAPQGTVRKPTPEEMSTETLAKEVRNEAITHPATVFPVTGAILAGASVVILGPTPVGILVAIGGLFFGASAWVINAYTRAPEKIKKKREKLLEQKRLYEEQKREQERQAIVELAEECVELGFNEGAERAQALTAAYKELAGYTTENVERKRGVSLDEFRRDAEDTYLQGGSLLRQAVDTYKALESVDLEALQSQLQKWQDERKGLEDVTSRARSLDKLIEGQSKRIELFHQRKKQITQLLAQMGEIESELQATYLELVDLGNQDPLAMLNADDGAVSRLKSRREAARQVEEELRGESPEDQALTEEFRRAARGEQLDSQ